MSYDVDVGRAWLNYTSNCSALFYDHMPPVESDNEAHARGGLWTLDGLTGAQASKLIADAFDRIDQTRIKHWHGREVGEVEFCRLYDSPNGWGSAIGAILFLARIQSECIRQPRVKVRVSA